MNQRFIGPAFLVSIIAGILFCVVYVLNEAGNNNGPFESNFVYGVLLGLAFAGMGVGMILWAKHLMPTEEVEQHRHTIPSTDAEQQTLFDLVGDEAKSIGRRKVLVGLGLGSLGAIGLATLFPLKSLGPRSGNSLFNTDWKPGSRLVTPERRYVRPDDLEVGGILTVFPGPVGNVSDDELKKVHFTDAASTVLIRYDESLFEPLPGRQDWVAQGNVAYSKVCTHVGCPVGLYQEATGHLLCPCHQSTFDVNDGARAVFGPAARSLPQLPLAIDSDGYLIAQSDYREPVGPSFWNRGRKDVHEEEGEHA